MNFLDLNELKIKQIKSEKVEYHEIVFKEEIKSDITLRALSDLVNNALNKTKLDVIHTGQIPYYCIKLTGDIDEACFETLVNLITSALANKLMIKEGRKRERRLDVPENLLDHVFMSRSVLKNMINYKSLYDIFNVKITANDSFIYNLVKE